MKVTMTRIKSRKVKKEDTADQAATSAYSEGEGAK